MENMPDYAQRINARKVRAHQVDANGEVIVTKPKRKPPLGGAICKNAPAWMRARSERKRGAGCRC